MNNGDRLLRSQARLLALRQNLPNSYEVEESRVGEFHDQIAAVEEALEFVDYVLVMSVNPGFGGQKFIPQSVSKVRRLRQMIIEKQLNVRIEIDGGIDKLNIEKVVEAGAEIIVAGSAIFGTGNAEAAVKELRNATIQWV